MNFKLSNPYLSLLKMDEISGASELFSPPTATLDLFTDGVPVDIDAILTKSPLITGQAGSGKSNGVGRILEQVLSKGVQIFLIDFSGEHEGVVEMYASQFQKLTFPKDGREFAAEFIKTQQSIYLDCSLVTRKTYLEFLDAFLGEVFILKMQMQEHQRKPSLFVIEECQNFIPQWVNPSDQEAKLLPAVKGHFARFMLTGRKFGCPCMPITPRPSLADKSIISQCRLLMCLKTSYPLDVKLYGELIPGTVMRELRPALFKFKIGQCFYVADGKVSLRRFKLKKSPDLGKTPGFAATKGWKEGEGVAR